MLYLRPITPDKYLLRRSWFGLFGTSFVFMQNDLVLPQELANRVQPWMTTPRPFNFRARLSCRCTARNAADMLAANRYARPQTRQQLARIIVPIVELEIEKRLKQGTNPIGLVSALESFFAPSR